MKCLEINFKCDSRMPNRRSLIYTLFIASVIALSDCKHIFFHEPAGSISLIDSNHIKDVGFLQNKDEVKTTEEVPKEDTKHVKTEGKVNDEDNDKQKTTVETKSTESTVNTHDPSINENSENSTVTENKKEEAQHESEDAKPKHTTEKVDKNNHIRGIGIVEHHGIKAKDTKTDRRYAIIIISVCTLLISILFQLFGGFIENKVDDKNDKYISNVFNTCCRQLTTISLINLILWILLQSKVAVSLDYVFFERDNEVNASDGPIKTNTIEIAFEYSLYISVLFMIWYICYSLYFYLTVRNLIRWLRKVDELDVDLTIRKIDYVNKKWFSWLFYRNYISKWQFLALRYDFEENVINANIQGFDSAGIYFMDYLRVSLLEKSYTLLRVPNYCLVVVLIGILLLCHKFNKQNEVEILCMLLSLCFIFVITVYLHIKSIQKKLIATNLSHYLTSKNQKESDMVDQYVDGLGSYEIVKPQYKLQPLKPISHKFYTEYLYGTLSPNKHEQLFLFLSNGPNILLNIVATINYTILVLLSLWLFLMHDHSDTWLNDDFAANVFICSIITILAFIWPNLLYSLLIVTQGGMMIDVNILASVWETRRAENTKHGMELIDGIGLQAGLYSLVSGGDVQWRHLLAKFKTFSIAVREQLISSWNSLQNNEKGGSVTIKQAAKYLYSQGLTNVPPKLVNDFIKSFSRTIPGKLIQEEFLMFALMVKQVIVSPLDTVTLKPLFEEVYKIPWTCENGINCMSLQFICQQIGLKWSYGTRKHIIHFLSAGTKTEMSPEDFVVYMRDLEDYIMQKAQDNTHYIVYGSDTQVPVK